MPEKSMTDLFTMDPMEMTSTDIDDIIKHYRENRHKFIQNPAAAKGRTAKPKATDGIKLDLEL